MLQHVLHTHLQGSGGAGAARAGSAQVQVHRAVLETLVYDIAAILRHGRAHACIDELPDLGDNFAVGPGIDPGGAAAFLVSPDAGYVTGSIIAMDGGASARATPPEDASWN